MNIGCEHIIEDADGNMTGYDATVDLDTGIVSTDIESVYRDAQTRREYVLFRHEEYLVETSESGAMVVQPDALAKLAAAYRRGPRM